MKKHPTKAVKLNVRFDDKSRSYIGPQKNLKPLLTVIKGFDFAPVDQKSDLIPWREVVKADIEKYGEPGLMLRGARHKGNYTQVRLAKRLGITQCNLSKMENGRRPIGKKMAQRLAKVLKVDYRTFL